MKTYYGNYLGICISNQDPENRGRVQVFVPNVTTALFADWNEKQEDISLEVLGNNLPNGLTSPIVERLKQILPWAEGALPIVGTSVAGAYNPKTGNFNQTDVPEQTAGKALYNGQDGTINGSALTTKTTAYSPQAKGSAMEGGYSASRIGPDGTNNVRTLDDFSSGNSNYVTIAGDPSQYGSKYVIPSITYTNKAGQNITLQNVPAVVHDTGSAFKGAGQSHFDIPVGKDYTASQLNSQPYGTQGFQLTQVDNSTFNNARNGVKQTIDLNDPTSAPPGSALPAQSSPFLGPEGTKVYTGLEKDQAAILTIGGPKGDGTFDSVLKTANSYAGTKKDGSSYYADNEYGHMCHYATRNLTNAALGLGPDYFGPGNGSAKAAASNGYWEKGGYYEKVSTQNYSPVKGDIAITQGGEYGHVKTYLGGGVNGWSSDKINDSGNNIPNNPNATVYRLTDKGRQAMIDAGNAKPEDFTSPAPKENPNNLAGDGTAVAGDVATNKVKNTTSTVATVQDHTGLPQGMFTYPAPGAMLWVFFREGDPMFPVYFAASYGAAEWQAAQKASSPPAYGPKEQPDSEFDHQAMIRPNTAGAITFTGTVTDKDDYRAVRIAHANGGYMELHSKGTVHYTPNEHFHQVGGTSYHYCLNKENWTQGTDNHVVMGDQFTIVGNATQAAIDNAEEHYKLIKEINAKMLDD